MSGNSLNMIKLILKINYEPIDTWTNYDIKKEGLIKENDNLDSILHIAAIKVMYKNM